MDGRGICLLHYMGWVGDEEREDDDETHDHTPLLLLFFALLMPVWLYLELLLFRRNKIRMGECEFEFFFPFSLKTWLSITSFCY